MTSWRNRSYLPFLLVLLSFIDLSRGSCDNYFTVNEWTTEELMDLIPLIRTQSPEDVVECSVERHSINNSYMKFFLFHCFDRKNNNVSVTKKCEGDESGVKIRFHHFMCMIAQTLKRHVEGCEGFDSVCPFFSGGSPIIYDQTTAATLAETTTPATLPETTPATLPETTRTAAPTTTAVTSNPDGTFRGQLAHNSTAETNLTNLVVPLLVSVILLLLCICSFIWRQWRRDLKQLNTLQKMFSSDPELPVAVEVSQANSPACDTEVRGNGNESAFLLQSIVSNSPTPDTSEVSKKNRGVH